MQPACLDEVHGLYTHMYTKGNLMTKRYKIRQKMISIGDDFWIENQKGEKVYKVDGKALRIRKTLEFENANGDRVSFRNSRTSLRPVLFQQYLPV